MGLRILQPGPSKCLLKLAKDDKGPALGAIFLVEEEKFSCSYAS